MMKYIPLLAKRDVTDPALKDKWESYPYDLAIFHAWAHVPDTFVAYTKFNRTVWVEEDGGMPLLLKELAVVQTSVLSNSSYEWGNHGRAMISRGGTQAQVDALVLGETESNLFSETEKLIIQYATEVTIDAVPKEQTLDAMGKIFTNKQIMELTFAIGAYMLNSRTANLCGLTIGDDKAFN
jgi:4-carboxymuconolactone decarboxylase